MDSMDEEISDISQQPKQEENGGVKPDMIPKPLAVHRIKLYFAGAFLVILGAVLAVILHSFSMLTLCACSLYFFWKGFRIQKRYVDGKLCCIRAVCTSIAQKTVSRKTAVVIFRAENIDGQPRLYKFANLTKQEAELLIENQSYTIYFDEDDERTLIGYEVS